MSIYIIDKDDPIKKSIIGQLRDIRISTEKFRSLSDQISTILMLEAAQSLPTKSKRIKTWTGDFKRKKVIDEEKTLLVPILGAGFAMFPSCSNIIPSAATGQIGLSRKEGLMQDGKLEIIEEYIKLPSSNNYKVVLIDPMLATGSSSSHAIQALKKRSFSNIIMLNIIAAPEGIARIQKDHPDVHLFIAQKDKGLNEYGFIIEGLGDYGNRWRGFAPAA